MDPRALRDRYLPKAARPLALDRQLASLRLSPDGAVLAGGDFSGRIRRWNTREAVWTDLPDLTGHAGWVAALAFLPDRRHLLSADSHGRLSCWPHAEREARPTWSVEAAHDGWVRQVAVSPDGSKAASCGRDGKVRVWDTVKGAKVGEWAGVGADLLALTWTADGRAVLVGDLFGVVHRWVPGEARATGFAEARELHRLDRIQDVGGVRGLHLSSDGRTLAITGGVPASGGFVLATPTVVFCEAATGKRQGIVGVGTTNDGYIMDARWHPAGFLMAVTSGQPGRGGMFFLRPGDAAPFVQEARLPNAHHLVVLGEGRELIVSATNANSAGNGRNLDRDKRYPSNTSPLHRFALPAT